MKAFSIIKALTIPKYWCTIELTHRYTENGGEKMKFNDNLPIYIQITNLIKRRIASGDLKEGDKLASVRELSTQVKTNPNTVQRAYSELEREDLVFTQRGMGTFITENKEVVLKLKKNMASDIVKSFIFDMKSIGFKEEEILNLINIKMKEE